MTTISHITLGTNDMTKAAVFYDAVLKVLGLHRLAKAEGLPPAYQKPQGGPVIFVTDPFDGENATIGNGSHIAFAAESREMVDEFYRTAMALGGQDEGGPGLRPHYSEDYYAAYVRDLDGNKLQAVHVSG